MGLSLYPLIDARKQFGKHLPRQRSIVGGIVFYAVCVVSKKVGY
jgi:hypothetical protein